MIKNEYIEKEDHYEIIVYSKGERYVGKIDKDDYDKVKIRNWFVCSAKGRITGLCATFHWKIKKMHRFITNCTNKNMIVDHINHDTLDNRKSNLRICTKSQNNQNRKCVYKKSKYKSNIAGICWNIRDKKWQVRGRVNSKWVCLGYFKFDELDKAIITLDNWKKENIKDYEKFRKYLYPKKYHKLLGIEE